MDWFWNRKLGKKEYLMSKGLFILLSILILGTFTWAIIITHGSDQNHPYLYCPQNTQGECRNMLYNSPDCGIKIPADSPVCTTPFISAGNHLGTLPPFIFSYFWTIVFIEILIILFINHFFFNKGFFKDFKENFKEEDKDEIENL